MFLSKSDYMMAYNCVKALWLNKNRKDLMPNINEAQQTSFDIGNEVQELARQYFDNGVMVNAEPWDVINGVILTKKLAENHNILYEAFAQLSWGAFCRIDVLKKNGNGWDLIEIKSSNALKDEHIIDLAFQSYVFTNAGYNVKDCYVLHLNKEYKRSKAIDVKRLFKLEKVTSEVISRYNEVEELAPRFYDIQQTSTEPQIDLCKNCVNCPFFHYCGKNVPEYSIFDVLKNPTADMVYKRRGSAEIKEDIIEYCDDKNIIDVQCYLQNAIHIDKKEIAAFLNSLEYPLYYLDYESIMPAIPLFENSGTYNQIPFQFSLHIQKSKGGKLKHISFLHKEKTDPRRFLAEALVKTCGKKGSIIVYNDNFEKTRNRELAELFTDLSESLLEINSRIIDLLIPFRQRALYSPKQHSSASIKYVLPAFCDLSYTGMEIANGSQAMDRYLAFLTGTLSDEEEKILFKGLEDYCYQDTYAMVKLIDVLYEKSKEETN